MDPQPRRAHPVRDQRPGPRGRAGRPDVAAAEGPRLDRPVLPLDRHLPRLRHERARHHDRAVRHGQRPIVGRPPDAGPLRLRRAPPGVGVVARRDPDPPRRRHRPRRQDPPDGPGRDRGHGRGQLEPGRRPRGAQLRRHPQAAVRVRRREQRLRDQRAGREGAERQGRRGPGVRVRDPRRHRRRHGRARLLRGGPRGGRPGARRRRPDPHRGQGDPADRALVGRPADQVPLGRRPRGRQGQRPAADLPGPAARRGRAHGRYRGRADRRDRGDRRGRHRLRRGPARPGSLDGARLGVRRALAGRDAAAVARRRRGRRRVGAH